MMNDDRRLVKVGERTSTLSLAVKIVDTVTGQPPTETPQVRIEGFDAKPIENPSGYRLFLDLDRQPDRDLVTVHVDAGEQYQYESREVDLSDRDPSRPLRIDLAPAAPYKFLPGSTLVRGHVLDADNNRVDGAYVSIRGLDTSTETDGSGEFVLAIREDDTLEAEREDGEGGGNILKVDGDDPALEIRKSMRSDPITSVTLDGDDAIEEGAVTTLTVVIE